MLTTTGTLSAELRSYYDRNLLSRLLPNLVYAPYGQAKPMPANEGQSVQFRRFSSLSLATTPLSEGVTPAGNSLTVTPVTATPVQYGDFVELSDMLDFTAPDPILTETGGLLGEQAAAVVDTIVRDELVAGTSVQYAGAASVSRVTVGVADLMNWTEARKVVRTLTENKVKKMTEIVNPSTGVGSVPVNAAYVAIVGARTHYDLKNDAKWVPVEQYASNAGMLLPHEIGAMDDIRFVLTDNPKVFTGLGEGGIDVHCTLVMGRDAFGVIMPQGVRNIVKPFGSGQDPLDQRATTGWKALFCAKILQQLALVRIEHAVSA